MGYRSEVGLCLTAPAHAKLEDGLLHLPNGGGTTSAEEAKLIRDFFQIAYLKKDDTDGAIAYYWDSLKWYSDYPDVRFVENFLDSLDEEEYYLIRLGESDGDTEIKGGFWDNPFQMGIARGITFD